VGFPVQIRVISGLRPIAAQPIRLSRREGVDPVASAPALGQHPDAPDASEAIRMASRSNEAANDRRRMPRVHCRLHGRVTRGRERIRVRIIDISEGGLCLLTPVWLNPKQAAVIAIDVPGRGTASVHVEIWHVRREKSKTSSGKVWIAGAILRDADSAYTQLLEAAGLAVDVRADDSTTASPATPPRSPSSSPPPPISPPRSTRPSPAPASAVVAEEIDASEPRVFRLRCKAKGSPRTRVLSLAADSAEQAHTLARHDLGAEWDVLEVLEA